MKINYTLDSNNKIIDWHSIPFDETLPHIEIENNPFDVIHVGISQIINGQFIENLEEYQEYYAKQKVQEIKYQEIYQLKFHLQSTDYLTMKYMEGQLSEEDWNAAKTQRQEWRDRINELENQLK